MENNMWKYPTPIIGKMSGASFYPENNKDCIEITIKACKDTRVFAGDVVILSVDQYQELFNYYNQRSAELTTIGTQNLGLKQ